MKHYKIPDKENSETPTVEEWENPENHDCGWEVPDTESNIGPCQDGTRCGINATIIISICGVEVSVCRTHQNTALDWLSDVTNTEIDDTYYR